MIDTARKTSRRPAVLLASSKRRRPSLARRAWVLATVAALAAAQVLPAAAPAHAQARRPGPQQQQPSIATVRDAEIEQLLRDYSAPIFRAAGLRAGSIDIILVADKSFNAFVADGRKLFIHVGALMDARTPNEMIGVIAHEAGHIAGGHLIRLRQELANAQVLAIAGMLLGGAAAVGASRGGGAGNPGVGVAGAATGAQELVRRSLLRYQRSEEQAADRAALNYLAATGQSPKGMLDVFKRFGENSMFLASRVDPYTISHPLPQDRIANLEDTARKSPHFAKADPPALKARHDLARAKIIGYMEGADTVSRRYPASDNSLAARYARAVSLYRQGRGFDAIRQVDGLIAAQPRNPYFHELKGQILLESGRPREAVASLRQAVSLAPSQGLLKLMLAQAEISTGDPKLLDGAIRTLSNAMQREPNAAEGYRWLGRAYAQRGDIGMAELASAQYFFVLRQWKEAHTQAFRAKEKLKPGSPGWLKADDILNFRPPDK